MYCTLCEYFYMEEEYLCCNYSNIKIGFNIDDLYTSCERKERLGEHE